MTQSRKPGAVQGVMLLLPMTMSVMGVTVLTPIVPLLMAEFQDIPHHEYWVMGGVLTMPAIWVMLFSPIAGWMADRLGRRNLLVSTTLICDYFAGPDRERWLAGQTALASVSALGIVYLGGLLGAAYGWRGPFYLYVYSLPLACAVFATIWEPARGSTPAAESGAEEVSFARFPRNRVAGICAITLLASISFYTVITKNGEALYSLGVTDAAAIGKLTMLASIGVPVGTFAFWKLSRLDIGWLLFVDFALVGGGFVLMGRAAADILGDGECHTRICRGYRCRGHHGA